MGHPFLLLHARLVFVSFIELYLAKLDKCRAEDPCNDDCPVLPVVIGLSLPWSPHSPLSPTKGRHCGRHSDVERQQLNLVFTGYCHPLDGTFPTCVFRTLSLCLGPNASKVNDKMLRSPGFTRRKGQRGPRFVMLSGSESFFFVNCYRKTHNYV